MTSLLKQCDVVSMTPGILVISFLYDWFFLLLFYWCIYFVFLFLSYLRCVDVIWMLIVCYEIILYSWGGKRLLPGCPPLSCLSPSSGSAVKLQHSNPNKPFQQLLKKALRSSSNSHAKQCLKKKWSRVFLCKVSLMTDAQNISQLFFFFNVLKHAYS